jgi:hypothetical protein
MTTACPSSVIAARCLMDPAVFERTTGPVRWLAVAIIVLAVVVLRYTLPAPRVRRAALWSLLASVLLLWLLRPAAADATGRDRRATAATARRPS